MRELRLGSADFSALCEDILRSEGRLRFQATGNSMRPFIRDGDMLTVSATAGCDLRPGDIVLYLQTDGRTVVHRFVNSRGADLRISGDAMAGPGEIVEPRQVLGRVEACERDGRVVNVDHGMVRVLAVSLHRTWRLRSALRRVCALPRKGASRVLSMLQQTGVYRVLARAAIGRHVVYRAAEEDDLAGVAALYAHGRVAGFSGPPESLGLARCAGERTFVALVSGRVVAAVILARDAAAQARGGWHVEALLVRKRFRGAGIDEELLRMAAENMSAENETQTVDLRLPSPRSTEPDEG